MGKTKAKVPGLKKRPAPRTAFKKGQPRPAGAGRKKGTPNKFTRDMKEAFLHAFNKLGGSEWLYQLGKKDRRAFAGLCRAMLPTQLTGKDGGPISILTDKAVQGLPNLTDKELEILNSLLTKIGLGNVDEHTQP